jgi:hypothetical protein
MSHRILLALASILFFTAFSARADYELQVTSVERQFRALPGQSEEVFAHYAQALWIKGIDDGQSVDFVLGVPADYPSSGVPSDTIDACERLATQALAAQNLLVLRVVLQVPSQPWAGSTLVYDVSQSQIGGALVSCGLIHE